MHVFGGGLSVPRSLLFLIRQLMIGTLIVIGPGASAQVSPCIKAALGLTGSLPGPGLRGLGSDGVLV